MTRFLLPLSIPTREWQDTHKTQLSSEVFCTSHIALLCSGSCLCLWSFLCNESRLFKGRLTIQKACPPISSHNRLLSFHWNDYFTFSYCFPTFSSTTSRNNCATSCALE